MRLSWKQFFRYLILIVGVAGLLLRLLPTNRNHLNQPYHKSDASYPVESEKDKKTDSPVTQPIPSNTDIPANVISVLNHVLKYQEAPPNYVGGRIFDNREKRLKSNDGIGNRIEYHEWDVHPKIKGQNRGAERLITGSDHSAYYTSDHYQTFIKINL